MGAKAAFDDASSVFVSLMWGCFRKPECLASKFCITCAPGHHQVVLIRTQVVVIFNLRMTWACTAPSLDTDCTVTANQLLRLLLPKDQLQAMLSGFFVIGLGWMSWRRHICRRRARTWRMPAPQGQGSWPAVSQGQPWRGPSASGSGR